MRKVYLTVPFSQGSGIFDFCKKGERGMEWVNVEKFKREAGLCLQKFGLQALRSYARKVGLPIATKLNKEEMILQTIAVICDKFSRISKKIE